MTNDEFHDPFDDELGDDLRGLAHDALERHAAGVDAEAELAAFDPTVRPNTRPAGRQPGGMHGSMRSTTRWLAVAAAVMVVVAGAAFVVARRDGSELVSTPPDEPTATTAPTPPSTPTPTTGPVSTSTPTTEVGAGPTIAPPTSQPTSTTPSSTTATPTTPPTAEQCANEPLTPPSLVDGSAPGEYQIGPWGDVTAARWGGGIDDLNTVHQVLGAPIDATWLDDALADGRATVVGDFQAVAIPVGDPPLGGITIYLRDTASDCLRLYSVGPGLLGPEADALAAAWVRSLATGEPVELGPVGPAGADTFGRRFVDAEPFFAIDHFDADGNLVGTLTADEIAALHTDPMLPDGSTIVLGDERTDGRCQNRSLRRVTDGVATLVHPDLPDARSVTVTSDGKVVATRDVCPAGTRWGDPGTEWQLVVVDTTDPAARPLPVLIRTSDPAAIQYDDGEVVVALGWMEVDAVSPDGRYLTLLDVYSPEGTKWHLFDLDTSTVVDLPSDCDVPGDIVGPVRFVDDQAVVARLCATADEVPPADQYQLIGDGDVLLEIVDLGGASPELVAAVSHPGIVPDSHSRTVGVSVRPEGTGVGIAVILTAGGGVEDPSETYLFGSDQFGSGNPDPIDITRPGHELAWHPADLL